MNNTQDNIILIPNAHASEEHKILLESFEKLYSNGFPDDDEREDFALIMDRICNEAEVPRSIILIFDSAEDEVPGGLVADWYRDIGALHLTYLIVDPEARKQGIAKKLITVGIPMIKQYLKEFENVIIRSNFFESNDPLITTIDNFDAQTRLRIFSALGAKILPFDYVQPPLGEDKFEVHNLKLLTFSQFNAHETEMPTDDIINFLRAFYSAAPYHDNDSALLKMITQINRLGNKSDNFPEQAVIYPDAIIEDPVYHFETCSVTNHYLVEKSKDYLSPCKYFHSFETDLFNYRNQTHRPFKTRFVAYIPHARITMPAMYKYTSEGRVHFKLTHTQCLDAAISINQTVFLDKFNDSIVHLTIAPIKGSSFSELDIIKFSSFFGSKQEQVVYDEETKEILISDPNINKGELSSIQTVLSYYFEHEKDEIYDESEFKQLETGIIQLATSKIDESVEFYEYMSSDDIESIECEDVERFANTICGIILGIFDFNRMDCNEVKDTIVPLFETNDSFKVINRGVLLAITRNDEMLITTSNLVVSPYLLLPNTVLAYNKYLLEYADKCIDDAGSASLKSKLLNVRNILNKRYLNDIFQYKSEKEIIKYGNEQRGIDTSVINLTDRQAELDDRIRIESDNRSNFSDAVQAAILGTIAFLQIKHLFDQFITYITDKEFPYIFYALTPIIAFFLFRIVRSKQSTEDIKQLRTKKISAGNQMTHTE